MARAEQNPNFRLVTIRLLGQDIEGARKIAKQFGTTYQAWVREAVHNAVEAKLAEMKAVKRAATIR